MRDLSIYVGERVQFTKHSRPLGVRNGDMGTTTAIDEKKRVMSVHLDSGRDVLIPLRDYDSLELGYASVLRKLADTPPSRAYVICNHELSRSQFQALDRVSEHSQIYVHGLPPKQDEPPELLRKSRPTMPSRVASPELAASEAPELAR